MEEKTTTTPVVKKTTAKKTTTTAKKVTKPSKAEVENKKLRSELEEIKAQLGGLAEIKALMEKTLKEKQEVEAKLKEKDVLIEAKDLEIKENISSKKTRLKIPNDVGIVIRSNIDGEFTFSDNSGRTNVYIRLDNLGDEDVVTIEELRAFNNVRDSKWLKSGQISIVDVEDDNYDVEDIVNALRLNKLYNNEKSIAPNEIEKMFTDEVDSKRFDEILLNSNHLAEAIIQVGLVLKKNGKFNDNAKISLLKQRTRNVSFFN